MARSNSATHKIDFENATKSSKTRNMFKKDGNKNSHGGTDDKNPYSLHNDSLMDPDPTKSLPQSSTLKTLPLTAIFSRFKVTKSYKYIHRISKYESSRG